MNLTESLEWLWHRPAEANTNFFLPLEAPDPPLSAPGYFQLRLAEMRLTDARRWNTEIVPATFVLTEFNYGGERVRRPYFVSNALLANLPQGIDGGRLRVDFRDTLVLGPTPAIGGDVVLFVGLFQMPIGNRLTSAFSILEKLFQILPGAMGSYLKLAEQLAGEISSCLGDGDMRCLLGDRASIGSKLPPCGYRVYVKANGVPLDHTTLAVVDGMLKQRVGNRLVALTSHDYCLVKVEHLVQRDDYTSLPFHAAFETARKNLVFSQTDTARLQMLECISMIYGSPDLSEDDKSRLIAFYQAKLLATQTMRDGTIADVSPVRQMQTRVLQVGGFQGKNLSESLDQMHDLQRKFASAQAPADVPVNDELRNYLQSSDAVPQASAETLMKAIAVSTLVR